MIRFEKEGHRYFDGDRELISVSALMAKHGLAPDYSGVSESVLKAKAERGTLIHKEIEDYIKTGECGFTSECFHFSEFVEDSGIKVEASEKIVGNDICAGTIDLLLRNATGDPIIADIKTTASINYDAVSWQLSIYNELAKWRAAAFLVFHFTADGVLEVKTITPKKSSEVQRLFEAERNGTMFFPALPAILNDETLTELSDIESVIGKAKAMLEDAQERSQAIKNAIIRAMEENGIKTFERGSLRITYIAPTESKQIDSARLKKERPELAAEYEKIVRRGAQVRITPIKGANDE